MDSNELRNKLQKVAREYADKQSWPWLEPIELKLANSISGERVWSVQTNVFAVGMNIRMLIRENDFAVIEATFLPR